LVGYHVTTPRKLARYQASGAIWPPVRFWVTRADAERLARQTGRLLILRLAVPDAAVRVLPGHRSAPRVTDALVRAWRVEDASAGTRSLPRSPRAP